MSFSIFMENQIKQNLNTSKKKSFKKVIYYFFTVIITILVSIILIFILGVSIVVSVYYNNLPNVKGAIVINKSKKIAFYHQSNLNKHLIYVSYKNISPYMIKSMISAEDVHFFTDDEGINFLSTLRSLYNDVFQKQKGVQGASTITQQLVKNVFLSSNRTVQNKIKQILLSIKISQVYSKKQILDAYLNDIYFGSGSYGIYSASERYFGIPPSKLNLAQSSMIAGVVQAPSVYSPISGTNPKLGKVRQLYVLNQMIKHDNIINIPVSQIKAAESEKLIYRKINLKY